jgi:hypothetical protein
MSNASQPSPTSAYVLLILTIDEHRPQTFAIPTAQAQIVNQLLEFKDTTIDLFKKRSHYNRKEREIIELLGARGFIDDNYETDDENEAKPLDEYEIKEVKTPLTFTQMIHICMPMA